MCIKDSREDTGSPAAGFYETILSEPLRSFVRALANVNVVSSVGLWRSVTTAEHEGIIGSVEDSVVRRQAGFLVCLLIVLMEKMRFSISFISMWWERVVLQRAASMVV